MKWNAEKLDDLRVRMEESVREFVNNSEDEEDATRISGQVLGYWMYELDRCKEPE